MLLASAGLLDFILMLGSDALTVRNLEMVVVLRRRIASSRSSFYILNDVQSAVIDRSPSTAWSLRTKMSRDVRCLQNCDPSVSTRSPEWRRGSASYS
jgi:hypothetical protein